MPKWVAAPESIAEALQQLRERRVHRTFAGYLAVLHTAAAEGREATLHVNFRRFFDAFYAVPGGPKPYVIPFIELRQSIENEWFNKNVAGSYAPSSLRENSPFLQVVTVEGDGRSARYSLRENHEAFALEHLAYNVRLPVRPLAAFLYRNYAVDALSPTPDLWVDVFRRDFGYTGGPEKEGSFETLFDLGGDVVRWLQYPDWED